jgi:hypothetical protein
MEDSTSGAVVVIPLLLSEGAKAIGGHADLAWVAAIGAVYHRDLERVQYAAHVAEMTCPREAVRLLHVCRAGQAALPQPKRTVGMAADLSVVIAVQ